MADEQRGRGLGPTGETVRRRIKQLRGRTPVTELSEKLSDLGRPIPPLGLRRIESGHRRVDADDLVALAVALDVSPVTLLMPTSDDESDPVTVTGLADPAAAVSVWEWLRGRLARPGRDQIRVDTWPAWEQKQVLGRFSGDDQ